jgi:bifunctional UDP-N-acetylglucosamine pyrophosphorylase/glucosamine-1-phosphate N-acetyltransferase/UDP-N-acetylglucosamine pyrophosphorylase
MLKTTAVVLAAGKGTRMKSDLPKVLFPVLGRPMIHWVLDALTESGIHDVIVVVGYRDDLVRRELAARTVQFAQQSEQLGTGHAVQMTRPLLLQGKAPVLIVTGDSPMIQASSVRELLDIYQRETWDCLLGTLVKDNPTGLGRIVRDSQGVFQRIVEHKDATPDEQQIREVNMSTYLFERSSLLWALENLRNNNSQSEYYLTDCPELLKRNGKRVDARPVLKACESLSINTIEELGIVESKMLEMGYRCEN